MKLLLISMLEKPNGEVKMKYLLLLLLSFNLNALEYELTVKHLVVGQKLFGIIDFKQDAILFGGNAWHESGFGLSVNIARSTESANQSYVEGKFYTNKIYLLTTTSLMYKFDINKEWAIFAKAGYTDYKTNWKVNDVEPSWAIGKDSGYSYGVGVRYKMNDSALITFGYDDLYRKHKVGYGDEKTKAINFGFIWLI